MKKRHDHDESSSAVVEDRVTLEVYEGWLHFPKLEKSEEKSDVITESALDQELWGDTYIPVCTRE